MVSLFMESVVISFALGGVVGAVIAIHLLYRVKETPVVLEKANGILEGRDILQTDIDAKLKIPPRR